MSVYPNPASEEVIVKSAADLGDIQLFDRDGKRCFHRVAAAKAVIIPVSGLPEGVYFLQVRSCTQVGRRKLLVRH